jgi:hypothetical protein
MNLYRVRKTWFGKCILQAYHRAKNPEYSVWFDVPYKKAPTELRENERSLHDHTLQDSEDAGVY